jgi:hypothetical protein
MLADDINKSCDTRSTYLVIRFLLEAWIIINIKIGRKVLLMAEFAIMFVVLE